MIPSRITGARGQTGRHPPERFLLPDPSFPKHARNPQLRGIPDASRLSPSQEFQGRKDSHRRVAESRRRELSGPQGQDFLRREQGCFIRWHVNSATARQALLNAGDKSPALNRSAHRFFDGIVGERAERKGAFTAAWGAQTKFLGEDGHDPPGMLYAAKHPVSHTDRESEGRAHPPLPAQLAVLPKGERISKPPREFHALKSNPTGHARSHDRANAGLPLRLPGDEGPPGRPGFLIRDRPRGALPQGVEFNRRTQRRTQTPRHRFYNRDILAESDFDGCMGFSVAWNPKDGVNVSNEADFLPRRQRRGAQRRALQSGRVSKRFVKNVYSGRRTIAARIAVTVTLKPKAKAL